MSTPDAPVPGPETDPWADHESHAIDAGLGLGPAYYDIEPDLAPPGWYCGNEPETEPEAGS
jgi:hypothetical protein